MRRKEITYTAVREYGRSRSRSHIVESRGRYVGSVFGLYVQSTLCGVSAGEKIPLLPAPKASCSDCRNIYKVKTGKE